VEAGVDAAPMQKDVATWLEAGHDYDDVVSNAAKRCLETLRCSRIAPFTFNTSSVVETFRTPATSWSCTNNDADIELLSKLLADVSGILRHRRVIPDILRSKSEIEEPTVQKLDQ